MAERSPRDDPENMKNSEKGFLDYDVTDICFESIPGDNKDLNLQEKSTKINPDLCDDGAAQEPQVKGSASASSSAINESNKDTYASSSSRNRGTGEIRRVDKEKDRNDGDTPEESDNDSDQKERYREMERFYDRFLGLSDHREEAENREIQIDEETMNPQQQLRGLRGPNHGSTSSTSDRTNISRTLGMQSQLSPRAASWRLQNTYQQPPVANQMPRPNQLYIPPMSQDQMMYPYQDPEAYQRYPYQHPVANQMYPYQHPEAYQRYPL
ncbi:PREDICTED: uncharacterized protein LOC104707748 [Camelina sativa]|uniref:Uncharacterized protein LOC104707748 n=1 Tax=Camelina sativa TaxID=90675 RepID=A0ABM0T8G4_CAMSA|nr:PREDICTED: uncharacterized protein LOC104707748 [Camelina sativa]